MKYDICSLGNAIVDITFQIETEFQQKLISKGISPSSMTLIDQKEQRELLDDLNTNFKKESFMACGGSATNSIIAASNFGSHCYYSCKVADDEFGNFSAKISSKFAGISRKCLKSGRYTEMLVKSARSTWKCKKKPENYLFNQGKLFSQK